MGWVFQARNRLLPMAAPGGQLGTVSWLDPASMRPKIFDVAHAALQGKQKASKAFIEVVNAECKTDGHVVHGGGGDHTHTSIYIYIYVYIYIYTISANPQTTPHPHKAPHASEASQERGQTRCTLTYPLHSENQSMPSTVCS